LISCEGGSTPSSLTKILKMIQTFINWLINIFEDHEFNNEAIAQMNEKLKELDND